MEKRYKHRDHKDKLIYYECKKFAHYKSECSNLEDMEKEKKKEKKKKKRKIKEEKSHVYLGGFKFF